MKYLLLIHQDEQAWLSLGDAERQAIYGEYRQLRAETEASGHFVTGSELQPTSSSTTAGFVRARPASASIDRSSPRSESTDSSVVSATTRFR